MTICVPETDWSCSDEDWVAALDPVVKARAERLAWTSLQSLTGYQLALCPIVVRPCSKGCWERSKTWQAAPIWGGRGTFWGPSINSQGNWINSCGCGPRDCSCTALSEARLIGPVGGVVSVQLNGAVLDPSAYRVDNGNQLVRLDGDVWPACQDMEADLGDVDKITFAVTYYMGWAPNELSAFVAGVMAAEYAKACTGQQCQLPDNVIGITRQGVTMDIAAGAFPNGVTGIRVVDDWLFSINPNKLKQPTTIASPDFKPPRMTTVG